MNVEFFPLLFSKLLSFLSLQAPTTEKLPVLYLVDSIVKNIGGEYLAVFAKNLITSFICVFEKVQLFLLSFNIFSTTEKLFTCLLACFNVICSLPLCAQYKVDLIKFCKVGKFYLGEFDLVIILCCHSLLSTKQCLLFVG